MDVATGNGVNRRTLLKGAALTGAAVAVPVERLVAQGGEVERTDPVPLSVTLNVNGQRRRVSVDSRATLLDTLRHDLDLTGSKKGCGHGQCGACTVHVDGVRKLSCLTLVATVDGRQITTIEGLADGDTLHPMQVAFAQNDAFQCGYCTPGQIMSAIGCVKEGHVGSDAEIREYMSGNLCRCAAYPNIVAAVKQAAPRMEG